MNPGLTMSAAAAIACQLLTWIAERLGVEGPCDVLMADFGGRLDAFLHSRQLTAMLVAAGVTAFIHTARSVLRARGPRREPNAFWRSEHGS